MIFFCKMKNRCKKMKRETEQGTDISRQCCGKKSVGGFLNLICVSDMNIFMTVRYLNFKCPSYFLVNSREAALDISCFIFIAILCAF